MRNMYDPLSERAKFGEAAEVNVAQVLEQELGVKVVKVRDWAIERGVKEGWPLKMFGIEHGDLTFEWKGRRVYIENKCAGKRLIKISESTRKKFIGPDKFYSFPHPDGIHFIPSTSMSAYLGKCQLMVRPAEGEEDYDWEYRQVESRLIFDMRKAAVGVRDFQVTYLDVR